MGIKLSGAWIGALAVVGLSGSTQALLIDMDQVSTPRLTETGAVSVSPCMFLEGQNPGLSCAGLEELGPIGYLVGQRPIGDFKALPPISSVYPNLWADGHRVTATPAELVISGLAPGSYDVTLMSHNPLGTSLDVTVFEVNGVGPFEVPNDKSAVDLMAEQTLTVPVAVDGEGTIRIRYWSGNVFSQGILNGVLVIPEPGTITLLATGLGMAGAYRRR